MPKSSLILAIGLAAAMALPARAETAAFDFSIAGIRIGALTMEASASGGRYDARSRIETAGIVGVFADFFFDGTAGGSISDGRVVPGLYAATSKSPRALRKTEIDWENGTPVKVSVEPPRSTAPDPAQQGGTLDPVSAGFRLLRTMPAAEVCDTTVRVFDGSRLSQLEVAKPVASGDILTCAGAFARIEGEAHSMTDLRTFPFELVFRKIGTDARLERIEAPTNYGRAVLTRRN
jgi:hypothetical protein